MTEPPNGGNVQPGDSERGARSTDGTYRYTDDRTGEAMLACGECEETWPENRLEDGRCPDCRGER